MNHAALIHDLPGDAASRLRHAARWLVCLALALASSGCMGSFAKNSGASDAGASQATESALPASQSEESSSANPGAAVHSLNSAKNAVVAIRALGAFKEPETGKASYQAGRGSGILIDPSGIIVTDAHLVTGAEDLQVLVGGEAGRSYPAKILGVSECSDVAVLQITGDSFPYLQWRETPADSSTPIYIAGYSLESSQFSLTKGAILNTAKDGNTAWAASESQLQYESYLDLGIVGGPVLDASGRVIGVHQASDRNTRKGYGLPATTAKELVDRLLQGNGRDGIGINGQAVAGEDSQPAGIWVSAVQPGSVAQAAGLKSGDILREIGTLDLTQDSTLTSYCGFLRDFPPEQQIPISILRDGEALSGLLNGSPIVQAEEGEALITGLAESDILNPEATLPGEVLLFTGFANIDIWELFALPETDRFSAEVREEKLYIQVDREKLSVYALPKLRLPGDVRLEAAVETVAGPNLNNISLICRATEQGWYEFSMNSGGLWYIWRYDNGRYINMKSGGSLKINMMKAANQVWATCIGNSLSFYVNEELIGSVQDNHFSGEGQVGVSVSTFEIPGAGVEFDWFRVSVP